MDEEQKPQDTQPTNPNIPGTGQAANNTNIAGQTAQNPKVPPGIYPEVKSQPQHPMSASQLGLSEPKKARSFNLKRVIIKGLVVLLILGGIFTALVMTNMIALTEFKTVSYTNSKGTSYKFDFYSRHGSRQLQSGNTQLVSKVSKDGKFPLAVFISTAEASGYSKVKDCASYTKVFDVQNGKLGQTIAVCDFTASMGEADGVYVAGFMHNDQAHTITITQDYSDIDLSGPSGAQESLKRFGLKSYKQDVERIISSISVE